MNAREKLLTLIAAAAVSLSLVAVKPTDAALILEMEFAGSNLFVPTLQPNVPGGEVFSFDGNNSYAVYTVSGGAVTGFAGLSSSPSATSSTLSIQVVITDNAPGSMLDGARLFNVTHDVRTSGGGGGNASLVLTATETNFMSPTGLVDLSSLFSFAATAGTGTGSFLSQLLDGGGGVLASVSGTGSTSFAGLTAPFQLRNVTTITEVGPNTNYNTNGQTLVTPQQVTLISEPSTLAMASLVLGLLALRHGRRWLRKARS
jgi:hypothetical protein